MNILFPYLFFSVDLNYILLLICLYLSTRALKVDLHTVYPRSLDHFCKVTSIQNGSRLLGHTVWHHHVIFQIYNSEKNLPLERQFLYSCHDNFANLIFNSS